MEYFRALRFSIVALLLLLPVAGGARQFQVGERPLYHHTSSSPSVPNAACFVPGAVTTYTTAAVNTAGAEAVAVTISYDEGNLASITDNLDSTSLTFLTSYQSDGSNAVMIAYEIPESTGSATFTVTGTGTLFAQMCVIPITGISGVYDSNVTGTPPGSGATCQAGSITPGAGSHIAIAGYTALNTGSASIDSSYTIIGQSAFGTGVNFGGGAAYLVTGSATNPTWSSLSASACTIASFH